MDHSIWTAIAASFPRPWSQRRRWYTVLAFSVWISGIAAQTVTLSANDPRITYDGAWTDEGDHKSASSPGALLTFNFTGTGMSWISRRNWSGGVAQLELDDTTKFIDESNGTNPGDAPQITVLFSQSGLDGTKSHSFLLTYEKVGQFSGAEIEVYAFEYVLAGEAPTTFSSVTSTSSTSTSSNLISSTSPLQAGHSKTAQSTLIGGIVGGILGAVLGGVLLSIFVLCLLRRRVARRTRSTTGLVRRAQPYTLRPNTEDGFRYAPRPLVESIFPIRRKTAMPAPSEVTLHDGSYRAMQQIGTSLAPALGPSHEGSGLDNSGAASALADAQGSASPNERPRPASTSSDNDSHGNPPSYSHPPSYSRVPARYAPHRLSSDAIQKN